MAARWSRNGTALVRQVVTQRDTKAKPNKQAMNYMTGVLYLYWAQSPLQMLPLTEKTLKTVA
jgi:hypothetical protein